MFYLKFGCNKQNYGGSTSKTLKQKQALIGKGVTEIQNTNLQHSHFQKWNQ